jgi:ubiquinone/menaquinone biosynthesis C-methylase UbiE
MNPARDHNAHIVDQFSQQAESYAALMRTNASAPSQAMLALVRPAPDDVVLEACCGPGTMALDLAPVVAHATGLDLTPAMLAQARAEQGRRGLVNVDWREGDVYALPFADEAFSLVLCSGAFHHLERPQSAFAELVRVCRPGGRVFLRDVTPEPATSAAYDRIEKLRDPSHTHALTPEEIRGLGRGLPVRDPELVPVAASGFRLEPILAASFPETCAIEDIRALILEDARSGQNALGLSAREQDGELFVSYPATMAVWARL